MKKLFITAMVLFTSLNVAFADCEKDYKSYLKTNDPKKKVALFSSAGASTGGGLALGYAFVIAGAFASNEAAIYTGYTISIAGTAIGVHLLRQGIKQAEDELSKKEVLKLISQSKNAFGEDLVELKEELEDTFGKEISLKRMVDVINSGNQKKAFCRPVTLQDRKDETKKLKTKVLYTKPQLLSFLQTTLQL